MSSPVKRLVYGFVITGGFLFTYFHMMLWADTAAKYTNYYISLFALPFLFGLILGCLGSMLIEKGISTGLKRNWKIKFLGVFSSLALVIYSLGVMYFVGC